MSKLVYRVKKVECTRCEDEQLLDIMHITEGYRADPKVRHTGEDKWERYVHCDCGNALSSKGTRFGPNGFEVIEIVDNVQADELEGQEPDFGALFN
jgi:hypothetical protein